MVLEEFTQQFADAIEVSRGEVNEATEFKQLEIWDSLCVLTIIAMVDTNYSIAIGGNDLESAKTVADVFGIVQSRIK